MKRALVNLCECNGPALVDVETPPQELSIPLNRPANPAQWAVGLDGLAVRLELPVVHVAGGLLRIVDAQGTVEYGGMLTVEVAGRGFTAIGAFSQPVDERGGYTSLFVFVSLPFSLGGQAEAPYAA